MPLLAAALFTTLVAAAAVSDIRKRKISNALNLLILAMGFAWRASWLDGWALLMGLAGVGVGLAMLIVPFAVRWVGAGDVKLLAAMGAWLGPVDIAYAGLFGLVGGGLLSIALAVYGGAQVRREVANNISAAVKTVTAPIAPKRAMALVVPLGVPLAAAAVGVLAVRGW